MTSPHSISLPESIQHWLRPLPDGTGGPNLEYDADFLAMTRATEGKQESQFGGGVPPDWARVVVLSEGLMEKTRDLRLAASWAQASAHVRGLPGLIDGVNLLAGQLALWNILNPPFDEEDADNFVRHQAIESLADAAPFALHLRQIEVCTLPVLGRVTFRQLDPAFDAEQVESGGPTRAQVHALLTSETVHAEWFAKLAGQFSQAIEALISACSEYLLPERQPAFLVYKAALSTLKSLLPAPAEHGTNVNQTEAEKALFEPNRNYFQQNMEQSQGFIHKEGSLAMPSGGNGSMPVVVNSRESAGKAIDAVCDFLERSEPGNPAQFLLKRAKSMLDRNFLEILNELAPDALSDVAKVMGVNPEDIRNKSR
ncbi:MAG: hypothetical protein HC848_07490 [Limnobacter sp.]|nr:hypothetical protein [Limnobacter sp.]